MAEAATKTVGSLRPGQPQHERGEEVGSGAEALTDMASSPAVGGGQGGREEGGRGLLCSWKQATEQYRTEQPGQRYLWSAERHTRQMLPWGEFGGGGQ